MWRDIRIDDIADLKYGKSLPSGQRVDGKIPVYGSGGITGYNDKSLVKAGIIIGRKGTVGSVRFSKEPFFPIDTVFYVDEVAPDNDLKFFYYFLQTIKLDEFNSDAAVPGLNRNLVKKLKGKVPGYEEQVNIASILSKYDDLIEVNNQRIKLLEETAQELYKEWFVRMRFPGYKTTKFEKGLPLSWKLKALKCFGKVVTGKTPSTLRKDYYGGSVPFIKTPDMHGNMFILSTCEYITEKAVDSQKSQTINKDCIIVNCIGALAGSVSITIDRCQTNQQINAIKINDFKYREFLYFAVSDLKEVIHLYGNTGSTMTNLSKGKFESLEVFTPSEELIYQYNKVASPLFEQIKCLGQQSMQLREIRDRLLPRLISGKLKVKIAEETPCL